MPLMRAVSPLLEGAPRPKAPLILYEYEASPFCRKVREAALLLDITLELRPCPGARAGFASELKERTGRMTVPYVSLYILALPCLLARMISSFLFLLPSVPRL